EYTRLLALVEAEDRVAQALFGVHLRGRRQRVVDVQRPVFLLERGQDQLLYARWLAETLDDDAGKKKSALDSVVVRRATVAVDWRRREVVGAKSPRTRHALAGEHEA